MKTLTLQRLILLLIATAMGLLLATHCKAQTFQITPWVTRKPILLDSIPPGFSVKSTGPIVTPQLPGFIPDIRQQAFAYRDSLTNVRKTLTNVRDSLTILNTRIDTLLAADKRVRLALKNEAQTAVNEANARLMAQAVQLENAEGMLSMTTARADTAEKELSRYKPRTWAGRQLRHVWNGAAWVGLGTVGYTVLRVFVFR